MDGSLGGGGLRLEQRVKRPPDELAADEKVKGHDGLALLLLFVVACFVFDDFLVPAAEEVVDDLGEAVAGEVGRDGLLEREKGVFFVFFPRKGVRKVSRRM